MKQLRLRIINQRKSLSRQAVDRAGQSFCRQLQNQALLKSVSHVGVYLSKDQELDLSPTIAWLWQQGKYCYLPVLHPYRDHYLWFARYTPSQVLHRNRYGILEPEVTANDLLAPWELDVVLMPLVAYDSRGSRLGMGGGYYDRSFAFLGKCPARIGCAYAFQQVDQLNVQPWDVSMHSVIAV